MLFEGMYRIRIMSPLMRLFYIRGYSREKNNFGCIQFHCVISEIG